MKLHIENLHVTLNTPQQPAGLLATLAIASAAGNFSENQTAPKIGEKWPGTEATYAGVSLSLTGNSPVHLLLWDAVSAIALNHDDAVKDAEQVKPEMNSHLPTRHQGITLFDNLPDHFSKDYWYWLITKTPNGKAAFTQGFLYGGQHYHDLSAECRVRAVSEIPL